MQISVSINKILLEYSHNHILVEGLLWLLSLTVQRAEEPREGPPAKSEIFTIWPFQGQKNLSLVEEKQALSQKLEKKKKSFTTIKLSSPQWGKTKGLDKLIPSSLGHIFTLNDRAQSSRHAHKQGLSWGLPGLNEAVDGTELAQSHRSSQSVLPTAPQWLPRSPPAPHHDSKIESFP